MNPGILFALAAYTFWGLFPLYFRLLRDVPALEVLMHRVVWSAVVVVLILTGLRRWRWVGDVVRAPRITLRYAISAVLIAVNWFVYIWSVQNGHVIDASLGYFITPLFSVLLGRVVLGERPRPVQWTAIAIAAAGVVWLGVQSGHAPWIGIALALSFSGYGLAKKTAPLGAIEGLAFETALLLPVAMVALAWMASSGQNAFAAGDDAMRWLLLGTGPLTAFSLMLFAAGARRIPLSMLGLLQYVSPTLQLLIGVVVFGEVFGVAALIGYSLIWVALVLYAAEGVWFVRRAPAVVAAPP